MNIIIAALAGASVYYSAQYPTLVLLMAFVCGILVSMSSNWSVAVLRKGLDREDEGRTRLQD